MNEDDLGATLSVRIADLLPSIQAPLDAARVGSDFDPAALTAAVRQEFGFLGPFITCWVEEEGSPKFRATLREHCAGVLGG